MELPLRLADENKGCTQQAIPENAKGYVYEAKNAIESWIELSISGQGRARRQD
jgi:hypothetical protein